MDLFSHIAVTFGLVLVAALIAGTVADSLRLPKVTGYLLMGVVLGPSVLHWLEDEHVHTLDPLTKLAIGLVLFGLGCQFPLQHLRRMGRRLLRLSAGEITATFSLVALGMWLFGQSWQAAILLGALALATAPATTVLVLKEAESEGPVTETAGGLVILNNFFSIVIFELIFFAIHLTGGEFQSSLTQGLTDLLTSVVGSVSLGIAAGLIVSLCCGLLAPSRWLVLLVAVTTFLLGVAEQLNMPYMLSYLAMGLTVANASEDARAINANIDRLTGFLCVLFFVIHGAELDLQAFLQAGAIGAAYVVLRVLGKYLGIFGAATLAHEPATLRYWLGSSMLAQAGAAIALASVAVRRDPELGEPIQTLILGTVVVFEIAGPLLIRLSILQAGEVPLARAVHHTSSTLWDELGTIAARLLTSIGKDPRQKRGPQDLQIGDLVRKNVSGISPSASFSEVISLIEHSHDNTYPVVDESQQLLGIIRYEELSRVMFDRSVGNLVRADDLASPAVWKLYLEDSVETAMQHFRISNHDCIPVLSSVEEPNYVGVVRRRDVLSYWRGVQDGPRPASGGGH